MSNDWDTAKADAQKILGKDGKTPKLRVDPTSLIPELNKAWDAFDKARGEIETQILNMQNAYSKAKNAMKQCGDTIDGNDFGLDDKAEKKRIDQVTDILLKGLASVENKCDEYIDELGKLDKVTQDLRKLKAVKL
ncbi:MAG TPA: hypothetical protein VKS60_07365 [Stellaceae bacterium]|nr:hypothetical protein [Stellaceae bacterium]